MQIVSGVNTLNVTMTLTTGTLTGKVTDSASGAGIAGVSVAMTGASTTTDSSGNYTIEGIPPGTYVITFSKTGYQSVVK
jgi:hypothetical protein